MRLGAPGGRARAEGTRARSSTASDVVHERHRHRYEVNNQYRPRLVEPGSTSRARSRRAGSSRSSSCPTTRGSSRASSTRSSSRARRGRRRSSASFVGAALEPRARAERRRGASASASSSSVGQADRDEDASCPATTAVLRRGTRRRTSSRPCAVSSMRPRCASALAASMLRPRRVSGDRRDVGRPSARRSSSRVVPEGVAGVLVGRDVAAVLVGDEDEHRAVRR